MSLRHPVTNLSLQDTGERHTERTERHGERDTQKEQKDMGRETHRKTRGERHTERYWERERGLISSYDH